MGRREGVVELLEREYKEYTPLLKVIKQAAMQIIDNYDKNFLTISHAADADGLASATVLSNIVTIVKEFYGQEVTPTNNKVTRIMGFSKERTNKDSLTKITGEQKEDTFYLISDLGTLVSKEFNDLAINGTINNAINIDHHKAADLLQNYYNINPKKYVKDGLPEMSASSLSAVLLHYVVKELKNNLTVKQALDPKTQKLLKKIEKQANYLTLVALGGDKADMQGAFGLTKGLYDAMIKKKVLEKVNTPYHGYKTKSLSNVIAESDLPFNLKYQIATPKIVRNVLGLKDSVELKKRDYEILKKIFVMDSENKGGVNSYYIKRLSQHQINTINQVSIKLTGENLIDYSDKINTFIKNYEVNYNDFKDDIYTHGKRQNLARNLLKNKGFESKDTAAKLDKEKQKELNEIFRENLELFSDYENKERFDAVFNQTNYCGKRLGKFVLKNWSPGENGTYMTSMSKMGGGEFFMWGVEKELEIIKGTIKEDDKEYLEIVDELSAIYKKYKKTIHECMDKMEELIDTKTGFYQLKKDVYYLDMTPVREIYEKKDYEDFIKMVGVLGGMATKARLLPNHYGVLYTGIETDGIVKISARINLGPKQEVDFGKFYTSAVEKGICINGGGHKEASSGRLNEFKLDEFKKYIQNYKLITKKVA